MRHRLALAAIALASASASADPAPDLRLEWQEGEMSRDMSIWTTTITVTGARIHCERRYAGRDSGMPWTRPSALDGVLADPKQLAAALAALDRAPVPRPRKRSPGDGMRHSTGCLTRGKATRCARPLDEAATNADYRAMVALRDLLMTGLPTPPP